MKTDPEAAGFDPVRLERITEHLERAYITPKKIAGCQVTVVRGGEVAYFRTLGTRRLDSDEPLADDAIFRIYSMSKPITSVALMTLFEKGLFQLGDPISRWIPEFADVKVRSKDPDGSRIKVDPVRPIQVRDVLSHTGGLSYGRALLTLVDPAAAAAEPSAGADATAEGRSLAGVGTLGGLATREDTLATAIPKVAAMDLQYQPGTAWMYSFSTDVCGRLVECISGMSFDDYLQHELFDPLGMVDTAFFVPEDKLHRLPANYMRRPDKSLRLVDDPDKSTFRRQPNFLSGGGGLVSTSADYLRFCRMLAEGGEVDGVRVLGRKTIELMAANHLPGGQTLADLAMGAFSETAYDGIGFGLGFATTLDRVVSQSPTAGDFYWGGAASTIFWIDPQEELAVIFMTQLLPSATFNFRGQLKSIVYGALAT